MADRPGEPRPAAFLDRDGVINVDDGYSYRPELLQLTRTAAEGVRLLNEAGYLVIVVTNQSGVARGYYGTADVDRFNAAIAEALLPRQAHIDAFYYSPYHPEGVVAEYAREHEDRKPGAGMIFRAAREWPIDLQRSFMIGDKASDAEAAAAASIPSLLVPQNRCDLAEAVRTMLAAAHG